MCVHCLPSAKICQPRSSGSAQVASRFRAVYLHLFDSPLLFVCLSCDACFCSCRLWNEWVVKRDHLRSSWSLHFSLALSLSLSPPSHWSVLICKFATMCSIHKMPWGFWAHYWGQQQQQRQGATKTAQIGEQSRQATQVAIESKWFGERVNDKQIPCLL